MQEGVVAFRDWSTWYRIAGDVAKRPPLICVHGGPGSSHHYFARLEELARRGRAVVLYDQVGAEVRRAPRLMSSTFRPTLPNWRTCAPSSNSIALSYWELPGVGCSPSSTP